MKPLLPLLFICLQSFAQTDYHMVFPDSVQVTEVYSDEVWNGSGLLKVKVWDDPARMQVTSNDTTYQITLYLSDQKKVYFVFENEHAEVYGSQVNKSDVRQYVADPDPYKYRKIGVLLLLLLLFI